MVHPRPTEGRPSAELAEQVKHLRRNVLVNSALIDGAQRIANFGGLLFGFARSPRFIRRLNGVLRFGPSIAVQFVREIQCSTPPDLRFA